MRAEIFLILLDAEVNWEEESINLELYPSNIQP